MDSNINKIIKRSSFIWNDLYTYLQSDFRLRFALEYVNSHYYNYGSKRVLSRQEPNSEKLNREGKRQASRTEDESDYNEDSYNERINNGTSNINDN